MESPLLCNRLALSDRSGEEVYLSTAGHHSTRQIVEHPTEQSAQTIALDDLISDDRPPVLIKIDVEGAEIATLKGAQRLMESGAMAIYEDHGNDPDCKTSAFLLAQESIRVLHISDTGELQPLHSIDEIRALKHNPEFGYNFAALREDSPFFTYLRAAREA